MKDNTTITVSPQSDLEPSKAAAQIESPESAAQTEPSKAAAQTESPAAAQTEPPKAAAQTEPSQAESAKQRAAQAKTLDITASALERLNDIFADMVAVGLFDGHYLFPPEDLVDANLRGNYVNDQGEHRAMYNDVAKAWKSGSCILCRMNLENETSINKKLNVLKYLGYFGSQYKEQAIINYGELGQPGLA